MCLTVKRGYQACRHEVYLKGIKVSKRIYLIIQMLLTNLTTTRNGATKRSSLIVKLVQVDRQYTSMKKKLQRRNLVPNQLGSGLLAPRRRFPHYQSSITLKIAKRAQSSAVICGKQRCHPTVRQPFSFTKPNLTCASFSLDTLPVLK